MAENIFFTILFIIVGIFLLGLFIAAIFMVIAYLAYWRPKEKKLRDKIATMQQNKVSSLVNDQYFTTAANVTDAKGDTIIMEPVPTVEQIGIPPMVDLEQMEHPTAPPKTTRSRRLFGRRK